jgi:hypothetical protein
MRLMFVHHVIEDRGSAQDIHNYMQMASGLGHEVAVYGRPNAHSSFNYSLDIESANAVIFIFEWTTDLQFGDNLDLMRLVSRVPRERRVVIDCDGKYNDALHVAGDSNHPDAVTSRRWIEICDSLSDKIFQPTLRPLRANVRPFFFHAYNPAWEVPLNFREKEYGMIYVGNNWFRWRALRRVLEAVATVRTRVGRITLVGHGWNAPAPWASPTLIEDADYTEPGYLEGLAVEVQAPVRFDAVIGWMGKGIFNPVIYRPLFDRLRLVTCRSYETVAANTIPLFAQDEEFVTDVYGEEAAALVLLEGSGAAEKIADVVERPEHYAGVVAGMRQRLGEKHSYEVRLRELMRIVES